VTAPQPVGPLFGRAARAKTTRPHDRKAAPLRVRRQARPSAQSDDTARNGDAGTDDLRAQMKDIAAQVASQSAGISDGLRAMFSARIDAARRSGMSAADIAALVRAIRHEMQATLRAVADRAAQELTARTTSAVLSHAGKRGDPTKGRRRPGGPKRH